VGTTKKRKMDSSSNLTNVLPATVLDIIFRLPLDLFKKLFGSFYAYQVFLVLIPQ